MSTQNDLLNDDNSKLERMGNEAPESADMFPNRQQDVDPNFPPYTDDAYRNSRLYYQGKEIIIKKCRK